MRRQLHSHPALGRPTSASPPSSCAYPGLNRPVAATPIANVLAARSSLHARADQADRRDAQISSRCRQADMRPRTRVAAGATVVVPIDSRSAAVAATPPLEPLEIADPQVVSVTSSSARLTWKTNVPAQTQTAFGLDAPDDLGAAERRQPALSTRAS